VKKLQTTITFYKELGLRHQKMKVARNRVTKPLAKSRRWLGLQKIQNSII